MLPSQRSLFNIPKDIIYMNTAYMSPLLNSVIHAINEGTQAKANPWKIKISDFYENVEEARFLFSQIVNTESSSIAIVPSASYGIETAAKNILLTANQNIVILDQQFPSNVYPWFRMAKENNATIKMVPVKIEHNLTTQILNSINENCKVVALPNVLWTTGQVIDLVTIRQKCDFVNAALVLDLTQSVGAMSIDFNLVKPDFAVVANYKWMLGPYATGFLYVDPKYHNGNPLEGGWISRQNSQDFSNLVNYSTKYQSGAIRFDMGERSNFSLIPGVITALEQLLAWEIPEIEITLSSQNSNLTSKLKSLGLEVIKETHRGPHFLSAQLPTDSNPKLLNILELKGIYLSKRGNSLRITPHLWNTQSEFDYFISELSALI